MFCIFLLINITKLNTFNETNYNVYFITQFLCCIIRSVPPAIKILTQFCSDWICFYYLSYINGYILNFLQDKCMIFLQSFFLYLFNKLQLGFLIPCKNVEDIFFEVKITLKKIFFFCTFKFIIKFVIFFFRNPENKLAKNLFANYSKKKQ